MLNIGHAKFINRKLHYFAYDKRIRLFSQKRPKVFNNVISFHGDKYPMKNNKCLIAFYDDDVFFEDINHLKVDKLYFLYSRTDFKRNEFVLKPKINFDRYGNLYPAGVSDKFKNCAIYKYDSTNHGPLNFEDFNFQLHRCTHESRAKAILKDRIIDNNAGLIKMFYNSEYELKDNSNRFIRKFGLQVCCEDEIRFININKYNQIFVLDKPVTYSTRELFSVETILKNPLFDTEIIVISHHLGRANTIPIDKLDSLEKARNGKTFYLSLKANFYPIDKTSIAIYHTKESIRLLILFNETIFNELKKRSIKYNL